MSPNVLTVLLLMHSENTEKAIYARNDTKKYRQSKRENIQFFMFTKKESLLNSTHVKTFKAL